jgi:hypothetical protein
MPTRRKPQSENVLLMPLDGCARMRAEMRVLQAELENQREAVDAWRAMLQQTREALEALVASAQAMQPVLEHSQARAASACDAARRMLEDASQ